MLKRAIEFVAVVGACLLCVGASVVDKSTGLCEMCWRRWAR